MLNRRRHWTIWLLSLIYLLTRAYYSDHATAELPRPQARLTLYVSPSGNDDWSGLLSESNADGTDGPLATLRRARDAVRERKGGDGLAGPVNVVLRGGFHLLSEPLSFSPADSGTSDCPITYQSWPGEKPVISGGQAIENWEADDSPQSRNRCEGKLWRARLPELESGGKWQFNQLFIDGNRRTRARVPNKGEFLRTDGPLQPGSSRGFFLHQGDLQPWENLREAIVVVYHSWETSIHHIRRLDIENGILELHEAAPWGMGRWERQQRYYVENVFEELDEPGEWYLDRASGTVYYYPLPGERKEDICAIAPRVNSTLIAFEADASQGEAIEHIHFRGLAFEHTNSELQRLRNPGQGEIYQPGLIMATGLRNASFEKCTVAHTGAHAIWLSSGCEDVRIAECHLRDLGGGGVYIGGGWGQHESAVTQRIVVDNNFIHDGSHMFHGAHGVWIGKSSYNAVTHNEISNFDYSGISCGWSWGFQPSSAHHNQLDFNHIHHLGNGDGLGDMGGIYTLGISPGTTERYNHIHHVYNYAHVSHGSGVYPDEGSSEILIENNVVYRVRTCPLFQHYGKDNIVRNNVLAFGGKGQMQRCREDKPCHYIAEGNIVYADIPQMLGGVWKSGDWKVGRNVYWSTTGPPEFAGMDFPTWQIKGKDEGSIVADPLFIDPQNGDFRLKPESPALALGFKPIDLSRTGLYGEPEWTDLPSQFPDRPLNEVPAAVEPPFVANFDFESEGLASEPFDLSVVRGDQGASVVVAQDPVDPDNQCLKFVDAPGQRYGFTPHVFCNPSHSSGKVILRWDMLNTAAQPAKLNLEVRQWEGSPYLVGPTVSVSPQGKVTVGGRDLGTIPLGKWAHVDIEMELGEGKPKTYSLTLTAPERRPVTVELPYGSKDFEKITWLGITSGSDAKTVFCIDNLQLGTPEQLEHPPKRRSLQRSPDAGVFVPKNDELLVGYWNFDEGDGYVAEDRSGHGNDGDVWASWATGEFGSAIYCDSRDSHVLVHDDPSLRFGLSDISIELWLLPTQLAIESKDARRRLMSKDGYPKTWWNLNLTTEGRPFLEMVDDDKGGCSNRPTGTLEENRWTHLAIVVDRSTGETRYYLNGRLDSSQKIPDRFTGKLDVKGGDLSIGSTWQPFIGLLDEVRIYRRALTGEAIASRYEKEKTHYQSTTYRVIP